MILRPTGLGELYFKGRILLVRVQEGAALGSSCPVSQLPGTCLLTYHPPYCPFIPLPEGHLWPFKRYT